MPQTIKNLKFESLGAGYWINKGTEVEILRYENEKVVIRASALFYTCNQKQPKSTIVTFVTETENIA